MDFPALPDFYEDPLFQTTQQDLYGRGKDILSGNLPDYYKILGESNSPEFQDVLRMSSRDIQTSALEAAAKTGTRGGAVASAVSRATGDMTSRLRYNDLLSTLMNKKYLFGAGLDTLGGVRTNALNFGGQKNQFNLGRYGLEMDQLKMEQAQEMAEDDMWAQIIAGGLGAAGTIAGAMIGGPAGAAVGGTLGAKAGGALKGSNYAGMDFNDTLSYNYPY